MRRGVGTMFVTVGVLWLLAKGGTVQESKSRSRVDSSLEKLVPSFRVKVLELLQRMRGLGFRPVVFETYRSPSRAAELAAKGTGVALSQHTLGLAVDILDAEKMWDAPRVFWDALHRNALELGLGRIKRRDVNGNLDWDLPHVQALPGAYDAKMRALLTAARREEFLRERYLA